MSGLFLRQVVLVAEDLDDAVDRLHAALGLDVAHADPAVAQFGLVNAVLPVGSQFLEVIAPTAADAPARRFLDRRGGPGGYQVVLQTDDRTPYRARAGELGIRIVLEFTEDDFTCLQLHPADIGGALLEIDEQPGGPDGPWHPAGDDWASAVRTETVVGITGVRVQSASPGEVAQRWSEVLGRPVVDDASIELDNATIRFVVDTDGRGPGLSGVELAVAEGASAGDVVLCGTQFTLGC